MNRTLVGVGRAGVAVAALGSLVAVSTAVEEYDDPFVVLLAALSCLVLSVSVVGSAAVRAAPRNPVSWILLSAGAALPVALAGFVYSRAAWVDGHDLPAASVAAWLDGWPWVPGIVLVPTLGVLLFPDGRVPGPRWRILLRIELVLAVVLVAWALFENRALDFADRDNLTGLPGAAGDVFYGMGAAIALVFPLSLASAIAFERRRRRSEGRDRAVLDSVRVAVWLIVASWFGCLAIGVAGGDTLAAIPAETVGIAALGVSCWVAIRRHALFDARLAIRRGLVYGALTVLVMAVYAVVATTLTRVGADHLATPVALALGVVLALPLRDRLQRVANRVVFGVREDPYATLIRVGEQLETSASGEVALANAAQALLETLRVLHVAICLGDDVIAAAGSPAPGAQHEVPLVHGGERIGSIVLTLRPEQERLTEDREGLLVGVARQLAAAAHATALSRALLSSRERIVTATEDERRRLRRDLHDGLGPSLSGAVLGIARAQDLLDRDPAAAARQLEVLRTQVQDAVADVRRLVYGLRPPALDELGLVGALDEQAQWLGPITVVGPAEPFALSAAVEVAAYRIAMEAMTNAVRHAHAGAVHVDVRLNGRLELEITDDGVGLPDAFRAGVGIASMRERAAELGGECTVERRDPRGTLVRATVPLEVP
jgi:two-component system, NarL family, sensor kinase